MTRVVVFEKQPSMFWEQPFAKYKWSAVLAPVFAEGREGEAGRYS